VVPPVMTLGRGNLEEPPLVIDVDVQIIIDNSICEDCGSTMTADYCIGCRSKALGCSHKATAIFLMRDEKGKIYDFHHVWIH